MFLNKSWNNLSHTPTLLHSQHAMQRDTWPPAVAWEPSHPHSWCVCVRVCMRKILALAQDKVIWYCTAPTSMNNSEEQERREMWQASSAGKGRKRDWERHRWRQSEICHEFECWDCGNAINVWRGYKSFWFETRMYCYAWLLMYWLSNSNGKQVLHTLRPPTHTSGGKTNQNSLSFKFYCLCPQF